MRRQRVRRGFTADDVHLVDSAFKSALGCFQLQDHAARDHARFDEVINLFAGQRGDHFLAVQNARDIGEIDQMIGADEFRASRGHVVGVDVVELAIGAKPEASGNRQQSFRATKIPGSEH